MPANILRCLIACVLLLLAACGGGQSGLHVSQISPDLTAAPLPALTPGGLAMSLPEDGKQPWETLDADGHVEFPERSSSSINASTDFTPGVERFRESGDAVDNLEATRLNAVDDSGSSYAMYRVSMGAAQPGVLSVDANMLSGKGYYVAVSNYGTGRWDWRGPFSDNHIRLQVLPEASDDLTSALGNTFVTVLCPAGVSVDVVGIGINQYDPASTTAPATPTGLTAIPVPGGLELSWSPVLENDLAGYAIYYSDSAFVSPAATGVRRLSYLEGSPRHILSGLQSKTYVGITAIDFSGNASAISTLTNAAPLATAPIALALSTDKVSGLLNSAISLTATGADSYDWDLDGDGIFEVESDNSGTQSADTSATGLLRPRVRGRNASGDHVALGGLSLIVIGNSRPAARAYATPSTGDVPLEVEVSVIVDDAEDEPDQLILDWDLDGDGFFEPDSNLTPINLIYNVPSLYNVKARVTDSQGAWDVDTLSILATGIDPNNLAPQADFDIDIPAPYAPFFALLDASASFDPDGSIELYEFGFKSDGSFQTSSSESFAQHQFMTRGVFSVVLRVTDNTGARAQLTKYLSLPSAWSQSRGDQNGRGNSFFPGPLSEETRWATDFFGGVQGTAAIGGDGTVYVGCMDNKLHALDPVDGSEKWSFPTGDQVRSSAAVASDGTIYFGSLDDSIYAVHPNGYFKWSFDTGGDVFSSPVIGYDESIYVGSYSGNLYKLSPDGDVIWVFDMSEPIHAAPAVGINGMVYCTLLDGFLVAIGPDGIFKWQYQSLGAIYGSPAIRYDGSVCFGSADGSLYAVNPDGSERWTYPTGDTILGTPAIGFAESVYFGSSDGNFYALDAEGNLFWNYPVPDGIESGIVIDVSGNVYFGGKDGYVRALDNSGNLIWDYNLNSNIFAGPCIDSDGTLYIGSMSGDFAAFGTPLP